MCHAQRGVEIGFKFEVVLHAHYGHGESIKMDKLPQSMSQNQY